MGGGLAADRGDFSLPGAVERRADGAVLEIEHLDGLFHGLGLDLGMGLFGQFIDVGDGGDFGFVVGIDFEGAEGAVGLEGAELLDGAVVSALGAGLVAGEAVEGGGDFGAGEIGGGAGADFGFDAAEAVKIPGGVEDLVGGDGFDGALRGELGGEPIAESGEFLVFIDANDECLAVSPCLRAFWATWDLPSGVTGPVECCALARLAVI
jgi:hypothetical protein